MISLETLQKKSSIWGSDNERQAPGKFTVQLVSATLRKPDQLESDRKKANAKALDKTKLLVYVSNICYNKI